VPSGLKARGVPADPRECSEGLREVRAALSSVGRGLFSSLASRIGFFVLAATLTSALAVAFTSALAVRAFLRSRVEDRIPDAASRARDRLELWYAQRALDVEVFANSDILEAGLGALTRDGNPRDATARAEVEQYLGYVREGLPVYAAIFALGARGELLASVGTDVGLAPATARALAAAASGSVSGALRLGTLGVGQVVSTPVHAASGANVTLHAVIPIAQLRGQLAAAIGESAGRLHVFDERGALVASSRDGYAGDLARELMLRDAAGRIAEYDAADGVRVVASAQPLANPRWWVVFEDDYGAAFAPIASILKRTVGLNLVIVIVLAAAAFAIARYPLRPLHALSEAALRLRDGETDVRLPTSSADHEVGVLARSFAEMVESLTRARATLEQLAITDGLTKIHNHRFFQDRLASEIRAAESSGAPLGLILLDIDDFKALNDTYGHATGDGVLVDLALLLVGNARPQDTVARYGGEEFVVLTRDLGLDDSVALAEQIRLAVHDHVFRGPVAGARVHVTVSIGVSSYQGDRARFFADADRGLYAAKHAGKDCVVAARDV
jgi:diguanylate cyclase (GGDEF)-like protein